MHYFADKIFVNEKTDRLTAFIGIYDGTGAK